MKSVSLAVEDVVDVLRAEGSDVSDIEAKAAHQGYPQDLAPTLSAFGNMPGGGVIVLGLDERAGFEAVGVYDAADAQARLAGQARRAVAPPLHVSFTTGQVDGSTIVLARVRELPSTDKPCEVTASGSAYLRSYDGDYPLSEPERQGFVANRGVARHDQAPVKGSTRDDLDDTLVATYIANCRARSPRLASMPDDAVLRHTRVVTREGVPTLAGIYTLGGYPQTYFPTLSITASVAARPGDPVGTRSADIAHFDGPLPELLDQAVAWVRRNTATRVRFGRDGHGRDEPEYPTEAVRELVANALVHRDLGPHALSTRVTMTLRDDRLVITNPGGLHGLTVEQLGAGTGGSARNQSLYDISKDVRTSDGRRVIEGIGSGIATVRQALKEAGMTPPHFVDAGIRFTAIVPEHALLDPEDLDWLATLTTAQGLSDTQRHALAAMRHGESWTNRSLRARFPMDSTEARTLLTDLVERGLAEAFGEGRGRVYRLGPAAGDRPHPVASATRSKHGDVIVMALIDGPRSIRELTDVTGLSERQVRYAVGRLRDAGEVDLLGGAGHRGTLYRLA
ncbi:ATP-binding protein [Myceligenerans indicum]|uniref:AAA family ATPase n=1 Tax=Myceligenerans indicum TaxID=2593663 RepID=A0ABS1LJ83_9MICO|nr:ATP-binding protein [Myceligenerans indicum]MBL0885888.1 AAA family ATPase [Myceligenerans indicum]